jgi:hypothetical protein
MSLNSASSDDFVRSNFSFGTTSPSAVDFLASDFNLHPVQSQLKLVTKISKRVNELYAAYTKTSSDLILSKSQLNMASLFKVEKEFDSCIYILTF